MTLDNGKKKETYIVEKMDLPGTYSLTSYTMEEQVSRQYILSDEVDVIIDVADASAMEMGVKGGGLPASDSLGGVLCGFPDRQPNFPMRGKEVW